MAGILVCTYISFLYVPYSLRRGAKEGKWAVRAHSDKLFAAANDKESRLRRFWKGSRSI